MDPHLLLCQIHTERLDLWLVLCLLIYLPIVHILRYQRATSLERKYAPEGRKSLRNMTAEDAQSILKTLAELEFPSLYGFSMVVALFRVSLPAAPDQYYILTGYVLDIRHPKHILPPRLHRSTEIP